MKYSIINVFILENMSDFDPHAFLMYIIEQTDVVDECKEECGKLQKSLLFVAPELMGQRFFNGYSDNPGICQILTKYAADNSATSLHIQEKYKEIYKIYTNSKI